MMEEAILEARGIWRGCGVPGGVTRWVLRGVDLVIMRGDFVAILGAAGTGKSALLRVLGFYDIPERGEVYFEGRLIGRGGPRELEAMRRDKVWLVSKPVNTAEAEGPQVVLVDEPMRFTSEHAITRMLEVIRRLNLSGIAVVVATRSPAMASRARLIYKLSDGKVMRLNGYKS